MERVSRAFCLNAVQQQSRAVAWAAARLALFIAADCGQPKQLGAGWRRYQVEWERWPPGSSDVVMRAARNHGQARDSRSTARACLFYPSFPTAICTARAATGALLARRAAFEWLEAGRERQQTTALVARPLVLSQTVRATALGRPNGQAP